MANVMRKAWAIAKKGQKRFGGKVRSYFAESLRLAWRMMKMKAIIKTSSGSKKHKSWVAQITGSDNTYKFNRNFVNDFEVEEGMYGNRIYKLDNGIYDVCNGGQREYIKVENGKVTEI